MSLKYFLIDNPLTPDPTDHRAVSKHDKTATEEDVIDLINYRNVGVSRSQIKSVLEEYTVAVQRLLKEGHKVQVPLVSITPTVAGVFLDNKDSFDRDRHGVNINVRPGVDLAMMAALIEPERVQPDQTLPIINTFLDITSNKEDEVITPGQPAKVFGLNLRIDPTDTRQGVYLVRTDTNKETKVSVFVDNQPSKLAFVLPTLTAGEYLLRVRTLINQKLYTAEHGFPLRVK